MRLISTLVVTNAVSAVVAAALPFAIVNAQLRISGRSFAPVEVAVAAAGTLAVVTAVVLIRAGLRRVHLMSYALAGTGLLQMGLGTFLVVALLLPPPYEWAMGVALLNLLVSWMTAFLASCVAVGAVIESASTRARTGHAQ